MDMARSMARPMVMSVMIVTVMILAMVVVAVVPARLMGVRVMFVVVMAVLMSVRMIRHGITVCHSVRFANRYTALF